MFPVDLIPELRDRIVSFLGPWDEIASFSLTCRQAVEAVEAVEAYSRRELDRIEREHDVDDTWRFRVGMQAAQDAAERLSSEGEQRLEGVMLVPNNISHRRMLRSAYRTYLYSLGTTTRSYDWTSLVALSMHPDGKHLLSGGHGTAGDPSVRLWDLSTKQCIKSFVGHEKSVDKVGFSAGHIVSACKKQIRIWSMDGVCKHVVGLPGGIDNPHSSVEALAISNDSVYAMDKTGPIYVINTITGSVRTAMVQPWGDAEVEFSVVVLRVCTNYLLCMRSDEEDYHNDDPSQNALGIYIFDRDSMDVRGYVAGNYCSMASTSDGDVALATYRGQIQVYQLRDGSLVSRLSIFLPIHGYAYPCYYTEVLYMTKSSIFVRYVSRGEAQLPRIAVYSSINGALEGRLCFPFGDLDPAAEAARHYPWAMDSHGREIFLGFNHGFKYRAGGTVKAYLLK